MKTADPFTPDQVDAALTAMIAYAGDSEGAVRHLRYSGKRAPTPKELSVWVRVTYWERYEELREQFSHRNEETLANDFLDTARAAAQTARIAVEQARDKLLSHKDDDPAKTAVSLQKVGQSAIEKRLMVQARPTKITENRNMNEILRSLVARGIIEPPEGTPELEEVDAKPE